MQVYRRRPTGLSVRELSDHARAHRGSALWAGTRAVVGVVLIGLVGTELGGLWLLCGAVLLASVFWFVAAAGRAALVLPAVVLAGRPKWEGTRRSSWKLLATGDEIAASVDVLVGGLSAELGSPLIAVDDGELRGISATSALTRQEHPVLVAWGVGGRAHLGATGDRAGVWLRIEPKSGDAEGEVTFLVSDGAASETFEQVASRV